MKKAFNGQKKTTRKQKDCKNKNEITHEKIELNRVGLNC